MTPGINVTKQSMSDVGKFVIWDCAGQQEYAITHGMFLGGLEHSIFIVLYDCVKQDSIKVNQLLFVLYTIMCSILCPNYEGAQFYKSYWMHEGGMRILHSRILIEVPISQLGVLHVDFLLASYTYWGIPRISFPISVLHIRSHCSAVPISALRYWAHAISGPTSVLCDLK